jgi:redox-sensitive bicupin YhaK (pirin superfamily)
MADNTVLAVERLTFPWQTLDPFLFCVHHLDRYPAGDERMAPRASLAGRMPGQDFSGRDGWSMYHGHTVPGFPRHPHRGFETVTIALQGFIDHSDSLGATARFGPGDVQWMTAGRGVEHCEMFPLVHADAPNPTELFQIWLNLPARAKQAEPHFAMFWRDTIPTFRFGEGDAPATEVLVVAGALEGARAPAPPPDSWAADPAHEVAILVLRMDPGARWTLPAGSPCLNRALYFFEGDTVSVAGQSCRPGVRCLLQPDAATELCNGAAPARLLLLQGRPLGEPVVQHGPFVMNSPQEIEAAFRDYQRGAFGRWPWDASDPVHPRAAGRFAIHADGRRDAPTPAG